MHERELRAELGRYLGGFGPYDRRHTAPLFGQLPPRRQPTRTALALVGAGLAAAAVVAALLVPGWLRAARDTVPASTPPARASASPSAAPAPPPAALVVPVPGQAGTGLVRVDWSGHRLGVVSPPPDNILFGASPDGRLGLSVPTRGDGERTVFDAVDGHVVGTIPATVTNLRWADDSRHLCGLQSAQGGPRLVVATIGRTRGDIGLRSLPIHVTGSGTTFVSACSAVSDRAVLTNFWPVGRNQDAGDVEVLQLSTGATLLHHAFPAPAPFTNVYASPDGLFLVGSPLDATQSTVVDLLTGQEVAHMNGVALAFSADDRYLAVSSFVSETGRPGGTGRLVEWRTGRTVWQDRGQLAILGVEPNGDAIAVQLYGSDQQPPNHDVWLIVHPDGPAITIRRNGSGP